MSGSSGSRTDHLLADGQIQANDAVLVKPNAFKAEHPRHRSAKGRIQEGAAALRVFSALDSALMNPDWNMKRRILFADRMQSGDQFLLPAKHFGI